MSKPVFDDVFCWRGRRNRRSYILFLLAGWVAFCALTALLVLVGATASDDTGTVVAVGWLACVLPFAWANVAVTAQRCRDCGVTGWAALLCLLPYAGALFCLVLAAVPGTPGANRYGDAPARPPAAPRPAAQADRRFAA